MEKLTDDQVLATMKAGSALEMGRRAFSAACGRIEQAQMQRSRPTIFDIRRMEYEAVQKIAEALGVTLG